MTERHSLARTTGAHLLPGLLALFFYALAGRLALPFGLPPSFALFLSALVVLVPYEVGVLIRARRRLAGSDAREEVVPYRQPIPAWQYLAIVPLLLAWCFFCFFVVGPHEQRFLTERLSAWLPAWQIVPTAASGYSKAAMIGTLVFGLVVNGVALPVVEELYFRGYLLPRIPCGRWSPLASAILFSVYHFFSPWQNLTRVLAVAPIAYVVWWKQNVSLGIATHCLLNTIAMAMVLASFAR